MAPVSDRNEASKQENTPSVFEAEPPAGPEESATRDEGGRSSDVGEGGGADSEAESGSGSGSSAYEEEEDEDDDYDVSSTDSEESERGRRRRATQEAAINSAARKIMQDPRKRQEVRQRLDDLLAQAGAYSEFITEMLDAEEQEQQRREVEALAQLNASVSAATSGVDAGAADTAEPVVPAVATVATSEPLGAAYRPTSDGATLMSHQRRGIAWLTGLYQNGVNGILADEMGLGKTVQVIGFIARLCYERLVGPHLVVAPLATLPNWQREFARWAPDVRVLVLHGHSRDYAEKLETIRTQFRPPYTQSEKMGPATALELMRSRGGVVLTTFEVALRYKDAIAGMPAYWEEEAKLEYKARKKAIRRRPRDEPEDSGGKKSKTSKSKEEEPEPPLDSNSFKWGVLVVDEAHRMKNFECELIRALRAVPTSARLLLTGTPLQNRIAELWSILNFVAPELFESVAEFQIWFSVSAALVDDAAANDELAAEAATQAAIEADSAHSAPKRQKRIGPKKDELSAELADLTLAVNVADAAVATSPANGATSAMSRVAEEYYAVAKMHSVLRPFLLRRTKAILTELRLPPKYEVVVRCPLAPFQARAYNTIVSDSRTYRSNRLAQLRNCCIHPYLVSNAAFERWAEQAALYIATEARKEAKAKEAAKEVRLQRLREERQLAAVNRKIIAAQNAAAAAAAAAAAGSSTDGAAVDPTSGTAAKRGGPKKKPVAPVPTPTPASMVPAATSEASDSGSEFMPSHILFAMNPSIRVQYLRDLRTDSTKIDAAMRLLPQLIAAGHHCLVFSQFTRTLDIMEELLRAYNRGEPLGDPLFDPPLPAVAPPKGGTKAKQKGSGAATAEAVVVDDSSKKARKNRSNDKEGESAGTVSKKDQAKRTKQAATSPGDVAAAKKPAPKAKRSRRKEIETSSDDSDSEDDFVGFPEAPAEERATYEVECKMRAAIRHGDAAALAALSGANGGTSGKNKSLRKSEKTSPGGPTTAAGSALPALAGLPFGRIDGGNADSAHRQAVIDAFTLQTAADAPRVLLISTRAGGVGLNLARADTVLMLDADFNPHNDLQAIDRCHRIGQRRPALVMRFISVGTVEEAIWDCCTHKLRLEGLVIGCGRLNDKNAAMASDGGGSGSAPVPAPPLGGSDAAAASDPEAEQRREIEGIREALARLRSMQLTELSVARGNLLTDPKTPPPQASPSVMPLAAATSEAEPPHEGDAAAEAVRTSQQEHAGDDSERDEPELDDSGLPIGVLCRSSAGGFHFTVDSRRVGRGLDSLVDFPR